MSRIQADFLLAIVAVIWGSAFVSQSLGMASVGPYTFTGARFLLGALIIMPLAWRELRARAKSDHIEPLDRHDLKLILALGTLLLLGAAFQQIGIMSTTVTNAGFLTALYVPLVPLFAWLLFKHLPHWSIWPASTGCVAGTWLLTGGEQISLNSGDVWVIASSLFWAGHVLLVGHSATHRAGPFTVACGQFLVVGILASLIAFAIETVSIEQLKAAAGTIAYAGILSVGFGFTGQVIAQRHTPAADTAIILSMETAFAAIFGALWLDERLSTTGLVGCALIFISILAVQLLPLIRRPASATN